MGCFLHAHCGLGAPPHSLIQSPWHSLKLVMLSFFYEEIAQGQCDHSYCRRPPLLLRGGNRSRGHVWACSPLDTLLGGGAVHPLSLPRGLWARLWQVVFLPGHSGLALA